MEAETVALLSGVGEYGGTDDYAPVKSVKEAALVFWVETVKLWRIAGPIVFNILCQFGTQTLTTIFVGHLGDLQLSAVTISVSVIGTFSFGFMLGMGSALETLCGQAYGAGKVYMLGIYMQRSWIILSASCLVILPVYIFAGPILKLLGQNPELADIAGKFTIFTIPQLFSLAINFPTQKFLQAQSKVDVMAWIGLVALITHAVILWLFISVFGWGLIGAAAAFNITNWGISLAQLVYVFGWCRDAWTGFSWGAFNEIWAFVRLSFASALMLCLEVWYIMSITLLAGHLDNAVTAVGSLSICTNVNGLQAMIFIGINAAISVRVSNELGLGHPRAAKYSVYAIVFQSLIIGLVCMVVILITRDHIAIIFTNSKELQQAVSELAWLLGVTMVLNSVQPVISGVAIGGGWQAFVAYINLGSYYVFGVPLGFVLGYVAHFGVQGIWGGLIAGTALQTVILLFVLYRTNWTKEVEETNSRMRKWGGHEISTNNLGMASALETLCGQAFGAGQVHMLGIYMQRSWIILSFCCLILLPVYIYAGPILKLLGQDHEIADIAGKFTFFTIPDLFSLAINLPTQKFLQAQSKVDVMAWIGFLALVAHILMLSLFIPVFGWGLIGAAAAFNITNWGITVAQLVYVFGWCKDSWSGFSGAAFTEIWAFLMLSFASALMLCLELWYIPCIVLLSGHLDNAVIAVGSLSICTNVDLLQAMIFIGINGAISVRVSNELGLGHPRTAKYCVFTTVFQSLLLGLLCMVVILIARNHFAIIFTDSKELQQAVADLAWLLGITMVLNSVQPVISGVAIGGGWQGLVAYINLGSYYVLGVPLGFVLGYVARFGVEGIWGGLIIGLTLQTLILLFILCRTNWTKEVEETNSRMQKWGGQNVSTNKIFRENGSPSNQTMP